MFLFHLPSIDRFLELLHNVQRALSITQCNITNFPIFNQQNALPLPEGRIFAFGYSFVQLYHPFNVLERVLLLYVQLVLSDHLVLEQVEHNLFLQRCPLLQELFLVSA